MKVTVIRTNHPDKAWDQTVIEVTVMRTNHPVSGQGSCRPKKVHKTGAFYDSL
jgi:hypothetical protein